MRIPEYNYKRVAAVWMDDWAHLYWGAWRSGEASSWSLASKLGCVVERWRRCPAAGLATYSDRSLLTSGRLISGFLSITTRELLPFGWMTGLISIGTGCGIWIVPKNHS